MNENLKSFTEQSINSLEYIKANGAKEFSCDFNCSELEDYLHSDITKSEKYHELFKDLIEIKGPVVYWFEIISDIDRSELVSALSKYEGTDGHRVVPKIRKSFCVTSDCLYVGKVKGKFYGRVIQHLGYFTTPATQGLQLFHWAKDLSLKVKLHVIEFEKNMEDMMPAVEQYFANALSPLVGKHI